MVLRPDDTQIAPLGPPGEDDRSLEVAPAASASGWSFVATAALVCGLLVLSAML